jgi:FAD/FMN-containing dehydrogenase
MHFASSSSQASACSVEPGTLADIAVVLSLVGAARTPFAVKSGGHAQNPGFSSTPGVHVSMARFNEVTYDADAQTAWVGVSQHWDEVYAALEPFNVTALGGRVSGVGVGGLLLGGGEWLGLCIETRYMLLMGAVRVRVPVEPIWACN